MEDKTDQEIVFSKLEGLRGEIERIREVLERRYFNHLTFTDRDEAQGLMRDLKKKLTDEYERCHTMRTRREQKQREIDANRKFLQHLRKQHEKRNSEIFKKIKKRNSWR